MTSFGIISDMHSNDQDLEKAISLLEKKEVNAILHLGDVICRLNFSKPCSANRTIQLLREKGIIGIRGLHDINRLEQDAEKLTSDSINYLDGLPKSMHIPPQVLMIHANPIDNSSYIYEPTGARLILKKSPYRLIVIGHTHIPAAFSEDGQELIFKAPQKIRLNPSKKYVLNPGSVGAPKDGMPPSCGIFDYHRNTFEVIFI